MKLPSFVRTRSGPPAKSVAGKRLAAVIACMLASQAFAQLDTCPQTTNAASRIPIVIDGDRKSVV